MYQLSENGTILTYRPDRVLNLPTISKRHCLLFSESRDGEAVALVEALSVNGTFVNEALVGGIRLV